MKSEKYLKKISNDSPVQSNGNQMQYRGGAAQDVTTCPHVAEFRTESPFMGNLVHGSCQELSTNKKAILSPIARHLIGKKMAFSIAFLVLISRKHQFFRVSGPQDNQETC